MGLQPTTHETMVDNRREFIMGKRGRKKRSRKNNAANHGKRPNS
jgi:hypothetical protein